MAIGPAVMVVWIVFGGYYVNADNVPAALRWLPSASLIKQVGLGPGAGRRALGPRGAAAWRRAARCARSSSERPTNSAAAAAAAAAAVL